MTEYWVPSVDLAIRILKLLSRYKHKSCTLKEISELSESNSTTCLRVLRTLTQQDFVRFDEEKKRYSLGPYLIPLGNRAMEMNPLVTRAIAELAEVSARTGLTTVLIERLQDDKLIYIASQGPPNGHFTIAVSVGQQFSIHKVAFGRCFLAYDLPHTETFATIREQGYAVAHGELTPGISSFAVPIFKRAQDVEFVMACLAATNREIILAEAEIVRALREASQRLSEVSAKSAEG